ncbi:MAG: LytR family transcriptional regulator [Actinobacteria bacterium]|nr:LytR family transcriptional regulator [Actinomycetota bacterium]
MNKARGCFISFVIFFFIALIIVLIISFPNLRRSFEDDSARNISEESAESSLQGLSFNFGSKNYLFLGIDEKEGTRDFKGRTDTIMILHTGSLGKRDYLISIPRDTRVKLKGHGWNKINAAYVYGGEQMIKDEIYKLTGIETSRTMVINFEGFKKVIDALGGVVITVDEAMHDPLSGANFDPGTYLMNGEEALAFSRCRKTSGGDFDRVDRQKYLISEVIKQKMNFSVIGNAPQLIPILNEETKSDFSILDYITLGAVLVFSDKNIERITIPGKTSTIDGVSYVIVDEKEAKKFLSEYID